MNVSPVEVNKEDISLLVAGLDSIIFSTPARQERADELRVLLAIEFEALLLKDAQIDHGGD